MDLWEIALGFMDAQALLTADKLHLFDALDREPRTAADLADTIGLPADSTERMLVMLTALGIIRRRGDGRYENGRDADRRLVRGRPDYMGGLFEHLRNEVYPLWGHLEEALRERRAPWHHAFPHETARHEEMHEDPDALRAFLRGMHGLAYRAATEFASDSPELDDIEWAVDIGGASGAFLIALCERAPHLHGTVFDLPQVRPIAEDYFQRSGYDDRIDFVAGDFHHDPLPAGADAYHLGFVLHDWDAETGSMLLGKIADAAPDGAYLIIGEYLLNDDKSGPLFVARSDLNMLVAAEGRERSRAEYAEWAAGFGFRCRRVRPTSEGKNFLVLQKT